MNRPSVFLFVIAFLAATAIGDAAATLRIVPIVRGDSVVFSAELTDSFTSELRETIAGGVRTTFTYDVQLRLEVPAWVDRTMATAVVTTTDRYDTLTRLHNLSRTIDGRVDDALVTGSEAVARQWLTSLKAIPLCRTSILDSHRDYYVRIIARVRPSGGSLLGWTSSVTSQARFTFIP